MGERVLLRSGRASDVEAIARLDAEVFGAGAYPDFFFRQAHDVFGDLLQVAVLRTDALAGYALGALAAGQRQGWILSAAVSPEQRGHGVGRLLTIQVLHQLEMRGAEEVWLTVEPDNQAAIALYRRTGFRPVRAEPDYFGPGRGRALMVRAFGAAEPA